VFFDHGLLHGMETVALGQALDRGDGFAVKLGQEQDAGVQGLFALRVFHHHGASSAIPFVAAFFGAGEAACFA